MKDLQEKIDNFLDTGKVTGKEFFEWLQGCEYCGSEVEYNGESGQDRDCKWYTLTTEDGKEEEDFLLDTAKLEI